MHEVDGGHHARTHDDDRLQRAELTGPFYGDQATTYTVEIAQYDVTEDITRP